MKPFYILAFLICSYILSAQVAKDYAVLLRADVQSAPKSIKISWNSYPSATSYQVFRKRKDVTGWTPIATLSGTATSYTDTAMSTLSNWEYKVSRTGGISAEGYVFAGIEVPMPVNRGVCLLVVDSSVYPMLLTRVQRWITDVEGDGWNVKQILVARNANVVHIKDSIKAKYSEDPTSAHTIFLLGHVPVPYSGAFTVPPDGHTDHVAAWPSDGYYGDMDGVWTDASVNSTSGADPRNRNVPGDGKFDRSSFPTPIECWVGRVDFANLPIITTPEIDLLKQYLDRNHAFRNNDFAPRNRAIIDDNFGAFSGEAFASGGWRSIAPVVGDTAIEEGDLLTSTRSNSYLWAYACGAGSYTSCSGVGTSSDFASDSQQAVFMMMFGSYFGDWDMTNNLMRTALAKGTSLSICWSGRPHWIFHHTGLGEPLGYSVKITQFNLGLYITNTFQTGIHLSLLGDPTLRTHYIKPASNLVAEAISNHAKLTWTPATGLVAGYNIYRSLNGAPFEKVNNNPITSNSYSDSCLDFLGIYNYKVRSVLISKTASGTYWNEGTAVSDTCQVIKIPSASASFSYVTDTPGLFSFTPFSSDATKFKWYFGDGDSSNLVSPTHQYTNAGSYTVTLIASTDCNSATKQEIIFANTSVSEIENDFIQLYPNPTHSTFTLSGLIPGKAYDVRLIDVLGNIVMNASVSENTEFDISNMGSGMYLVRILDANGAISTRRLIIY